MKKIKQYKVTLMNSDGIKIHIVNCRDEIAAKIICEGLYPNMRVIEVIENIDN